MQESKVRAFIAIDLPEEIRSGIAEASERLASHGIKQVGRDQLHITMFFLGYLDLGQVEGVKALLSRLSVRRFPVSLGGVGTFDADRPRVVFVNITKGAKELEDIYARLSGGISALRIRMDERGFAPHLTIARVKGFSGREADAVKAFMSEFEGHDFGSFACCSIRLKSSVLTRAGPKYADLFVKELPA